MATTPQETGACWNCTHRVRTSICNELAQGRAQRLPSDSRQSSAIFVDESCVAYTSVMRILADGSHVFDLTPCFEAKPKPSNPLGSNPQCLTRF